MHQSVTRSGGVGISHTVSGIGLAAITHLITAALRLPRARPLRTRMANLPFPSRPRPRAKIHIPDRCRISALIMLMSIAVMPADAPSMRHSVIVRKNAIYFEVTPKKGFFFENDAPEIHSRQLSVNDTPLEGKAGYEVYALSSEAIKGALYNYGSWQDVPALQAQLKDIKNG